VQLMTSFGALTLIVLSACGHVCAATAEPYEFRTADGTTVAAEIGELTVPENRSQRDSRMLRLRYVRFPATTKTPGSPIVYLAGGPGGPGIEMARLERFPMFMALRDVADVIAFDQRGTGMSNDVPICESGVHTPPLDTALTPEGLRQAMHQAAAVCQRFWRDRGIDIAGYTTQQSAADLDDLRKALGASKLTLWGISYGAHLAFAALKQFEPRIDRVVIASGEGLDQTIKMPAHTDAFFARFSEALRVGNPGVATPDVPALLRRVHERLAQRPVSVAVKNAAGETVTVVVNTYAVQLLAASSITDPPATVRLIKLYEAMDRGDFSRVAQIFLSLPSTITLRGMPEAMDIASGVSNTRLAVIEQQAKTSLLSDLLNFPMPQLRGQLGVPDLGEQFRAPVKTAVPTLLVMGTLDGRTYLEAQSDNLRGFSNHYQINVENAGHNVWMTSPEITPAVIAFLKGTFLKGQQTLPERIATAPPKWP